MVWVRFLLQGICRSVRKTLHFTYVVSSISLICCRVQSSRSASSPSEHCLRMSEKAAFHTTSCCQAVMGIWYTYARLDQYLQAAIVARLPGEVNGQLVILYTYDQTFTLLPFTLNAVKCERAWVVIAVVLKCTLGSSSCLPVVELMHLMGLYIFGYSLYSISTHPLCTYCRDPMHKCICGFKRSRASDPTYPFPSCNRKHTHTSYMRLCTYYITCSLFQQTIELLPRHSVNWHKWERML